MMTSGLSLDQAPPIAIPFKFFLTAALFSLLVGLLVTVAGEQILQSRWTPETLAVTHAVTVGFLAQAMSGAIMQLLPVLAGAPLPASLSVSRVVHLAMSFGAVLLVLAFATGNHPLLVWGGLLLTLAFCVLIAATTVALLRTQGAREKLWTLGIGWVALLPALFLGVHMVLGLAGYLPMPDLPQLVTLHLSWGLIGWVGVVLFAVLFHLLPIFYVTREFPRWMQLWFPPAIIGLLMIVSLSHYLDGGVLKISLLAAVAMLLIMGMVVLQRVWRRKRMIVDATLLFILCGMVSLLLSAFAWVVGVSEILLGVLILGGVCLTVPVGIVYKVIPFLCWFHLQSLQVKTGCFDGEIPSMKAFITEQAARRHFHLHLVSLLLLLIASVFYSPLVQIAGFLFMLSSFYLVWNLSRAFVKYRRHHQRLLATSS